LESRPSRADRKKAEAAQSRAAVSTYAFRRDRQPREPDAGWSIRDAIIVIVSLVALMIAKQLFLGWAWVATLGPIEIVAARISALSLHYGLILGILAVLARRQGGLLGAFSLKPASLSARSVVGSLVLVVALLLATRAAGWVYQVVARVLGWEMPPIEDTSLIELFGPGMVGWVFIVLLVVIMAPLVEELVFRKVLLDGLGTRLTPLLALVGQAAIFALFHPSPWMWGPMLALGLACGWLAQHRATLWPAISLHMAYNAVLVAAVYYMNS